MIDGVRQRAGSIRFRITATATVVVAVVLSLAGIALVAAQRSVLTETLDETVEQRADELADLVRAGAVPDTLTGLGEDDTAAQVVTSAGDVVAASRNVAGRGPLADAPAGQGPGAVRTVHDLPHDPEPFRLLSRRVDGPDGPRVVHVAGTLDDIEESVTTLATSLLGAVPAVAVLLGALIWWLVGRTLRPVETMRAEVAAMGGADLHCRVPTPAGHDEIARLARTMNDMLDRVEGAARRQQQFVADASHELRGPLTRVRAELEVDLAHPGGSDPAATHRSVLAEAVALQRLVEDLLLLARSDAAAALGPVRVTEVDLDDVVARVARRLRAAGRVEVDSRGVGAVQVLGDADQLVRAVGNVADNAARHATGVVAFTLDQRDGVGVLTVTDDGPGIPPEHHDVVFERFARLDDARTTSAGGTGLGLAIARDIVVRHGGSIAVDASHHPGARFVLTLPVPPPR